MKFCAKCGKELLDEAVFCPNCGCATGAATPKEQGNHPVVGTSYLKLFTSSLLGGVIFGLLMALYCLALRVEIGMVLLMFVVLGLGFALLFFALMALLCCLLEKTTIKNIRKKIVLQEKIYFEGAASLKGNGGWLFVTQNGVEHRAHKMNVNSKPTSISHDEIVSIQRKGKQLVFHTDRAVYAFTVTNVKRWLELLGDFELTKNKI